MIVSIGDELVLGQTVDTNAAWLSRELAGLGLEVAEQVTVGDDEGAIGAVLRRLSDEGGVEVMLVTGGLGPTEDDLTRHALAKVLGVELQLDEAVLGQMQGFFDRLGRKMVDANRIQAMMPAGCGVLGNPLGTAAGMVVKVGGAEAFFLPGVPMEMKRMFGESVKGRLTEMVQAGGGGQVILTRVLHTVGTGESNIAELLGELMERGGNPVVNCTAAHGQVSIRINALGQDEAAAGGLIEPMEREVRRRLGELVFGVDEETLAEVVGRELKLRGLSLAVAESCTGGLLGKLITDVAGASEYFKGGWLVYSNEAKVEMLQVDGAVIEKEGAVSGLVAGQLAANCRWRAGSDFGIGITGIAGPGGGSESKPVGLVYIGLADEDGVTVERQVFGGDRAAVRLRTANFAMDMLRLRLK